MKIFVRGCKILRVVWFGVFWSDFARLKVHFYFLSVRLVIFAFRGWVIKRKEKGESFVGVERGGEGRGGKG